MRFLLVVLCAFAFNFHPVYAQGGGFTNKDIPSVKSSTTHFILDGGESTYDTNLKEAVEAEWTFNKYEFSEKKDFESIKGDASKSFILPIEFNYSSMSCGFNYEWITNPVTGQTKPEKSTGMSYSYHGLGMVKGGIKKGIGWNQWGIFCLLTHIEDYSKYDYKLNLYLREMQNILEDIEGGAKLGGVKAAGKFYNSRIEEGALKAKKLYLNAHDIPKDLKAEELSKIYGKSLIIAEPEDIKKVIVEKDENAYIINAPVTGGNRLYPYISRASDGYIIYVDMFMIYAPNPPKYWKNFITDLHEFATK